MKIVLVTGGFDPLHCGHLNYFTEARKLGDKLIVGVNSDAWLTRKKGQPFLPCWERMEIIRNLRMVDQVISFRDEDNSAIQAIAMVKQMYPQKHQLIFANGGDRTKNNIPEMIFDDVEFVFGVGGEEKQNSSRLILEKWQHPKVERSWGTWYVLEQRPGYKIKELIIDPGKRLSMQKHKHRAEHWYVLKGECTIETEYQGSNNIVTKKPNETYFIGKEVWHQGQNNSYETCHILEVQFGDRCEEEDIERK
jgi:cytidyltransferase-like protein